MGLQFLFFLIINVVVLVVLFSRLDLGPKIWYFFSPHRVITGSFAKMEVSITLLRGVTKLGFEVLLGGLC